MPTKQPPRIPLPLQLYQPRQTSAIPRLGSLITMSKVDIRGQPVKPAGLGKLVPPSCRHPVNNIIMTFIDVKALNIPVQEKSASQTINPPKRLFSRVTYMSATASLHGYAVSSLGTAATLPPGYLSMSRRPS